MKIHSKKYDICKEYKDAIETLESSIKKFKSEEIEKIKAGNGLNLISAQSDEPEKIILSYEGAEKEFEDEFLSH